MDQRIPNVIELGRRPDTIRYTWVLFLKEGSLHMGAGWTGLKRVVDLKEADRFFVIDVIKKRTYEADPKAWLKAWRPHYFDPNWDYPKNS